MNQYFISDVLYADVESKTKELTVNTNNTVQPVALMRLGVFVPKPTKNQPENKEIDASSIFSQLEIAQAEGYDNIKITGPRLDMDTDFKVWIGVIYSFSKYGLSSNTIQLSFQEFAKACGFPSKRLDGKLRNTIHESLGRLRNKGISFRRGKNAKGSYNTGLLKTGYFDAERDIVELEADSKLWEIFQLDYRVLLQQHALRALPKKEAAQAIYTFIESLPARPIPISFARIRERLALMSSVSEQNRTIKKAIEQLKSIGYLDCTIEKQGRENYIIVHARNPKLKLPA
ncbi:RepB family plasmid replication initiator protein [Salmonella enterica]|uniref:RepB family plasmid replication initiator protein n=1 Tax=Salmonella enterica TaxID=28901 RepID=A0A763ZMN7_SALER|nr:RepB family plasmid replication initiator protein [Salmonella enterica]EJF5344518.1 RepB family plasmid replication initiator protein [Salmonella enterica]HAG4692412.1 RepB family plasmid replication initiator protein [Salmonella enterica]